MLRSVYAYPVGQLSKALRAFAGLPGVTLEDPALTAEALTWVDGGMDFADALHLSKAAGCAGFLTFDHRVAQSTKKLGVNKVRTP